jgi:hypothetical protein
MNRPTRTRLGAFAALLILLLATSFAATSPGSAQTGVTTGDALTLVSQTSWVGPEGTFTVAFTDPGVAASTNFSLELHNPVSTRDQFLQTARGNQLGGILFSTVQRNQSEVATRTGGTFSLSLPLGDSYPSPTDGVVLFETGVYPVVIRASGPNGENRGRLITHLIRLGSADSTSPTLAVGAVVRIDAPVSVALDGSPFLEDPAAAAAAARIAVIGRYPQVRITTLPSPQTLQLLRSRADATNPLAPLRIPTTGHQLLGSTYAPLPSGSWIASGLTPSFRAQLGEGAATLGAVLESPPDGRVATVDPSVTPDVLSVLRENGVESVIVPSAQLTSLNDRSDEATLTQRFTVRAGNNDLLDAVASDSLVAGLLAATEDPVLAGHVALAQLAVVHLQQPGAARGIAVITPENADPRALETFLAGLADNSGSASGSAGAPMISPVTASDLLLATDAALGTTQGRTTTLVRSYTSDQPFSLGNYPEQLQFAERSLGGIKSLVPESPEIFEPVSRATYASGTASLDPVEQGSILGYASGLSGLVTSEIVVPQEQTVTLTSSSGLVPLTIENRLPVRAHVRIVLNSAKLDFPDGPVIDQVLEPATTTRIDVAVITKASGAFPLDVSIRSADGNVSVASTRFTVRSTAISGIGLVLSLGAGLFLLLWWARHFRTSRRAKKLIPAADRFPEQP